MGDFCFKLVLGQRGVVYVLANYRGQTVDPPKRGALLNDYSIHGGGGYSNEIGEKKYRPETFLLHFLFGPRHCRPPPPQQKGFLYVPSLTRILHIGNLQSHHQIESFSELELETKQEEIELKKQEQQVEYAQRVDEPMAERDQYILSKYINIVHCNADCQMYCSIAIF